MSSTDSILQQLNAYYDPRSYQELNWQGSFADYLELVKENPKVARNAYQRLYDVIMEHGTEEYTEFKKRIVRYRFFDDPFEGGKDAVFGIDVHLMKLVNVFRSAAQGYGTDRRVLLLHGPVGSAKSTIARLLKKGLEAYSRTPQGALYTLGFRTTDPDGKDIIQWCPMHGEPLQLIPQELRKSLFTTLSNEEYQVDVKGDVSPVMRFLFRQAMEETGGDWSAVMERVVVKRIVLSEADRVGIGTFQPKDEKNQDSTELTGDINYRNIAIYGSESDPRAFNFDGEFNIANRGIIEFVELLKLDVAFLYDLLTASQEHKIKPKKFAQCDIDLVIVGHTNEPEYRKLQNNEFMEALRDRTIKIDIPYITKVGQEVRIYERDFSAERVKKHIAPHTLHLAAMWAVLTRLEQPKKAKLTLVQKLKLYNGQMIPGYTEDNVKELRKEGKREGLEGISPRYVQDKISNALVNYDQACVNPFMVMRELESGLRHHSLIADEKLRKRYQAYLADVRAEFENLAKNDVRRAIVADEESIARLCGNYIDSVKAYIAKERIRNPYTGQPEPPNERLMRSIEEKIEIPESRKDDFRREIMNYIAVRALDGMRFDFRSNERLHRALELKLFEDKKDSIKLSSLVSQVVDPEAQAKIDIIKQRMIDQLGYDETSATDTLNYVASIFARGDAR